MQVQCSDGQCMMSQEVSKDIPRLASQTPSPRQPVIPGRSWRQDPPGFQRLGAKPASQPIPPMLKRSPKEPDDKLIWNFITDP